MALQREPQISQNTLPNLHLVQTQGTEELSIDVRENLRLPRSPLIPLFVLPQILVSFSRWAIGSSAWLPFAQPIDEHYIENAQPRVRTARLRRGPDQSWPYAKTRDYEGYTHEEGESEYLTPKGNRSVQARVLFPLFSVRIIEAYKKFVPVPGKFQLFVEKYLPFAYNELPTQPIGDAKWRNQDSKHVHEEDALKKLRHKTVLAPRNDLERIVFELVGAYTREVQSNEGRVQAIIDITEEIAAANPEIDYREAGTLVDQVVTTILDPRQRATKLESRGLPLSDNERGLITNQYTREYSGARTNSGRMQTQFDLSPLSSSKIIARQERNARIHRTLDILTFNYKPKANEGMWFGFIPYKKKSYVIGGENPKTRIVEVKDYERLSIEELKQKRIASKGNERNVSLEQGRERRGHKDNSFYVQPIARIDRKPNFRESFILFFLTSVPKTLEEMTFPFLRDPEFILQIDRSMRLWSARVLSTLFRVNFHNLISLPEEYGGLSQIEMEEIIRHDNFRYRLKIQKRLESIARENTGATSYSNDEPIAFGMTGKFVNGEINPQDGIFKKYEAPRDQLEDYVIVFLPNSKASNPTEMLLNGDRVNALASLPENGERLGLINNCNARIYRLDYINQLREKGQLDEIGLVEGKSLKVMSLNHARRLFSSQFNIDGVHITDAHTLRIYVHGLFDGLEEDFNCGTTINLRGIPIRDEDYIFEEISKANKPSRFETIEIPEELREMFNVEFVQEWVEIIRQRLPEKSRNRADGIVRDVMVRVIQISTGVVNQIYQETGVAFPPDYAQSEVAGDFLDIIARQVTEYKTLQDFRAELGEIKDSDRIERILFVQEEIERLEIEDIFNSINDRSLRGVRLCDRLLKLYEYNSQGSLSATKAVRGLIPEYVKRVSLSYKDRINEYYEKVYAFKKTKRELFVTSSGTNNFHSALRANKAYAAVEDLILEKTPQTISTLLSLIAGLFVIFPKK